MDPFLSCFRCWELMVSLHPSEDCPGLLEVTCWKPEMPGTFYSYPLRLAHSQCQMPGTWAQPSGPSGAIYSPSFPGTRLRRDFSRNHSFTSALSCFSHLFSTSTRILISSAASKEPDLIENGAKKIDPEKLSKHEDTELFSNWGKVTKIYLADQVEKIKDL